MLIVGGVTILYFCRYVIKMLLTLVSGLLLISAITGCGNTNTSYNDAMTSLETILPEVTVNQDSAEPLGGSIAMESELTQTWQEAFAELLLDYEWLIIGEYAELMWEIGNFDFPFSGLFTLHDMNGDGIPELIVWQAGQGGFFSVYSAYTYSNNEIVPLEILDYFGGRGPSIFSPPSNMQGIITTTVESGFTWYTLIKMEGHRLHAPISIYEDWTGLQSSYGDSLYFVRGLDVVPMDIPYELNHIFDCCCVEERALRGITYTFVAQEEFYRVLKDVFGNPDDLGDWPLEINETNIQNVIFWR